MPPDAPSSFPADLVVQIASIVASVFVAIFSINYAARIPERNKLRKDMFYKLVFPLYLAIAESSNWDDECLIVDKVINENKDLVGSSIPALFQSARTNNSDAVCVSTFHFHIVRAYSRLCTQLGFPFYTSPAFSVSMFAIIKEARSRSIVKAIFQQGVIVFLGVFIAILTSFTNRWVPAYVISFALVVVAIVTFVAECRQLKGLEPINISHTPPRK